MRTRDKDGEAERHAKAGKARKKRDWRCQLMMSVRPWEMRCKCVDVWIDEQQAIG